MLSTLLEFNCALLVDDDTVTNFLNRRIVDKLGISKNVQIALNGVEALSYIKEHYEATAKCPELILLDINMPLMSGFEFLDEYNKLPFINKEKVVIIVLTTSMHDKDLDKVKEYQVTAYINKPLTLEKLVEILPKHSPESNFK